MKRGPQGFDPFEVQEQPHKQPYVHTPPMCMKLLISMKEASTILGPGGSVCREIGQQTGTKLHLSGRSEFYPGTNLQELTVKGPSPDAVANAVLQVLGKLAEETGRITCGEHDVEEGGARVRCVVPVTAVRALIGRGGDNIKALRANSGLYMHIEEVAIGVGDAAEQIVSLQGSLRGIELALPNVIEKVAGAATEPGFATWVNTSHAGSGAPVATQMAPGKGGGLGKGGMGKGGGKGKGGYKGKAGGDWGNGWAGNHQAAQQYAGPEDFYQEAAPSALPASSEEQAHGAPISLDMIVSAVQMLPPSVLNPADRSQKVTFSCPASCVGAVIGKGGMGIKEICTATETKIMIRDIEDNTMEKAVTIMGGALGVVAAYLHVVGRIAGAQEMMMAGGCAVDGMLPQS